VRDELGKSFSRRYEQQSLTEVTGDTEELHPVSSVASVTSVRAIQFDDRRMHDHIEQRV